MRLFSLLACSAAASFGVASAAPQPEPVQESLQVTIPPPARVPADVAARLPAGAVTLHLGTLPIGPKGAPRMVHVWCAKRRSSSNSNFALEASPVCVDVFKPRGGGRFARETSAVFLSDDLPQEISSRWLRPAQKRGPVLVLVSPAYIGTKYTLIVFPQGLGADAGEGRSFVQNFYQGGVGGGKILQSFGVDTSGTMTVVTQSLAYGKLQSTVVNRWNGYEFKP